MNDKYTKQGADAFTILKYYYYHVPFVVNVVIPVVSLLSALLCFSNLGKYNELIVMQSAGVGKLRIILPALMAALSISVLLFFYNEYIGVDYTIKKYYVKDVEIYKEQPQNIDYRYNDIFTYKNNSVVQISELNIAERNLFNISVQYFSDSSLTVLKRIDADSAYWNEDNQLIYKNAHLRVKKHDNDTAYNHTFYETFIDSVIDVKAEDFIEKRFEAGKMERFLTLEELKEYSRKHASFGKKTSLVDYEIYNVYFFPLSIFFMTFLGAVIGSVHTRSSVMIYFILCIFICLIYIAIVIIGKILGQKDTIPPIAGASLPHLVTVLILLILSRR